MRVFNDLFEPEYDEAGFYDPATPFGATRVASGEVDFGVFWRNASGNAFERLSWVSATGEIVEVGGTTITVLGVVRERDDLEKGLQGWASRQSKPNSLEWLRETVAKAGWTTAWIPDLSVRICSGYKVFLRAKARFLMLVPLGAQPGEKESLFIPLRELSVFIDNARSMSAKAGLHPIVRGAGGRAGHVFAYVLGDREIVISPIAPFAIGVLGARGTIAIEPWELAAVANGLAAVYCSLRESAFGPTEGDY